MKYNELGPEQILSVYDPRLKFRGFVVVDNTRLGPAGGGTRMALDVSEGEVADLARGMTFKFAIMGLPRGGSKAGIIADPTQEPARKKEILFSFGQLIAQLLKDRVVAVGPDMGVGVEDVQEIYRGAGLENPRSGLFEQIHDGDAAAYHFTGRGVAAAAVTAARHAGVDASTCRVAIEGFGQVGVGTARYLHKAGPRVVAISTIAGMLHDPNGIDVPKLIELRREHGDDCILKYSGGSTGASDDLYFVDSDIMIPGARPYVINSENVSKLRCKIVCPAANIAVTSLGKLELHKQKILYVPDYVANAGGALASWVDFLKGSFEEALGVIEKRISAVTEEVLGESSQTGIPTFLTAEQIVVKKIRNAPAKHPSFEETTVTIRKLLLG